MSGKGTRSGSKGVARVEKGCCDVEAIVSVDERGQMVLPKDVRERAGIRPGEKLAVTLVRCDDAVCCIALVKADALSGPVEDMLAPAMREVP
jgi:antitoxin PrlF